MILTNKSTVSLIKRVFQHLSGVRKRQLAVLGVLMIVSSFMEAISVGSVLPFLASLTAPESLQQNAFIKPLLMHFQINSLHDLRLTFTLLFIAAVLFSGLFRIVFFWLQIRLCMATGTDFSVQVYENTLYQPYGDIIKRNSSEILAGAQKAKELVGYIILPTLIGISSILMLIAIVAPFFLIEPIVAALSIAGFGILYIFSTAMSKRLLQVNSQAYATELGRVNKAIQEGIGGIRDVIIDGAQASYASVYRLALTRMQAASAGNVILAQMPRYVIEMLGIALLAGMAFLMTGANENIVAAIPVLGVAALGAQKVLPILQQAYASYVTIRGAADSTLDALELLDQNTMTRQRPTEHKSLTFHKLIRVEDLFFSYEKKSKYVLSAINININKGERIGFIGATGSGKSTLVDIIMGLLTPTAGSIIIDGEQLGMGNMKNWHSCISHVPQTIFLSDSTVAENIAFGVKTQDIDMGRVYEAARIAQISQTIEDLPEGYQTYVGERGVRLSGGQRQRIGLARAIYKKSSVLILDEATSALDVETENRVMDAIDSLPERVTMMIIAHRIRTLQNCDLIIELRDGAEVWRGTYKQLFQRSLG